jgi:uncharacterized protein YydD (DUF2326 family)
MILSVTSSLPGFKSLTFHSGLNVLLSARDHGSSDKKTRNSAGKTSFVELVHFLLGADCNAESLFRKKALIDHTFEGAFLIAGTEVRVGRSGSNPSRILMDSETAGHLRISVKPDKVNGTTSISNSDWQQYLGHAMFGLPAVLKGSAYAESYTPSFRPLFSYFARRDGSGGFIALERQAEQQQRWDWQVNLSYLFGLDWRLSHELHKVRQRERTLRELKKAAKAGAFGSLLGTAAEIRPLFVTTRDKANRLNERLKNFEVVESYKELSAEAAEAKKGIQSIARRAVSLRETVAYLRGAMDGEVSAPLVNVEKLYEAVGVELPGAIIRRRLDQVEEFQRSVLANRRAHLMAEIARAEDELAEGELRSAALDRERSRIMTMLRSGGALDDFIELQRLLIEVEAEAAALAERLRTAEALERESTQLDVDRGNIKLRLIENLRSQGSDIEEAMLLIGHAIADLYGDRSGKFEVSATENGPEFEITIQGDDGSGISKMEIFCLDYALFINQLAKGKGPGFLLHDSHLFDGVDARQILEAIELGANAADLFGGQYIVCLNSDTLTSLSPETDIDWAEAIVQPVLRDSEQGGLFGSQFE